MHVAGNNCNHSDREHQVCVPDCACWTRYMLHVRCGSGKIPSDISAQCNALYINMTRHNVKCLNLLCMNPARAAAPSAPSSPVSLWFRWAGCCSTTQSQQHSMMLCYDIKTCVWLSLASLCAVPARAAAPSVPRSLLSRWCCEAGCCYIPPTR
jgi:hypothetical protein